MAASFALSVLSSPDVEDGDSAMADKPISLSKFRKTREREAAKRRADGNAAKFGRTKAEKLRERDQAERGIRHLDGHQRNSPTDEA